MCSHVACLIKIRLKHQLEDKKMLKILKYAAFTLFLFNASVCTASQEQFDLESQQRTPVVVHHQHTVNATAKSFLKHGAGDIAFLATTGVRQISDADVFKVLHIGVQAMRYYYLAQANVHATSDALRYKNWPYVFFATVMAIHAVGDLAFDLPSLATEIRNSVILNTILKALPIIEEWDGARQAIIGYAAGGADAIKLLAVPIAALTFTLILYRLQQDGTMDVVKKKLKSALGISNNAEAASSLASSSGKKSN